jgi:hypothetical protein
MLWASRKKIDSWRKTSRAEWVVNLTGKRHTADPHPALWLSATKTRSKDKKKAVQNDRLGSLI